MEKILILFSLVLLCNFSLGEDFHIKLLQKDNENETEGKDCLILQEETVKRFKGYKEDSPKSLYVSSKPAVTSPADAKLRDIPHSKDRIVEIYAKDKTILQAHVDLLCKTKSEIEPLKFTGPGSKLISKAPEILLLVDGGDEKNRIDVVFMGDGYTAEEKEKFFDDMIRLTEDMFEGTTFRSYLPLFNIWAIFVESAVSGIGYNGPQDTPFRLYREAGQLRAIYPGNAEYARQICKLTGEGACDYPSLIANDDYYGGLGGEFVISTKSKQTGTVVLRHEMGHNFVDVGEEYDNGYVYSGVNAARTVASLGWTHWLSGDKKEERAIYRLSEYPWHDLSKGPVEFKFRSDGKYSRYYLIVSVSAAGETDSLEFLLDGKVLPWNTTGSDDREFYDWNGDDGFTAGSHTFSVRSKTASTNREIPRMICSVNLHEFGNEDEYHADNNYVSAYPTWDAYGRKTFRPTNAGCLMRNMTHAEFCDICKEGMWYQFLQRVSLIDKVDVKPDPENGEVLSVTVATLKLGQLRDPNLPVPGEKLKVEWFLKGDEIESLRDKFTISATKGSGSWSVRVSFITSEVRSDPTGLLSDTTAFDI